MYDARCNEYFKIGLSYFFGVNVLRRSIRRDGEHREVTFWVTEQGSDLESCTEQVIESVSLLGRRERVVRHHDRAFCAPVFPARTPGQKEVILAAFGLEFLVMPSLHDLKLLTAGMDKFFCEIRGVRSLSNARVLVLFTSSKEDLRPLPSSCRMGSGSAQAGQAECIGHDEWRVVRLGAKKIFESLAFFRVGRVVVVRKGIVGGIVEV